MLRDHYVEKVFSSTPLDGNDRIEVEGIVMFTKVCLLKYRQEKKDLDNARRELDIATLKKNQAEVTRLTSEIEEKENECENNEFATDILLSVGVCSKESIMNSIEGDKRRAEQFAKALDDDGNGKLDKEELKQYFAKQGVH